MLGEQIAEELGQITGTRVLASDDGKGPTIEVSFQAAGHLLGIEATDMGTYVSTPRPDGTLRASGQGCVLTADGDIITWTGAAVGRFTGHGSAVSRRGSVIYYTQSAKLARVNGILGIFDYDTDESGKTQGRIYEWK